MDFYFNCSKLLDSDCNGFAVVDSAHVNIINIDKKRDISFIIDKFSQVSLADKPSINFNSHIFWKSKTQRIYFLIENNCVLSYLLTDICFIRTSSNVINRLIIDFFVHYSHYSTNKTKIIEKMLVSYEKFTRENHIFFTFMTNTYLNLIETIFKVKLSGNLNR